MSNFVTLVLTTPMSATPWLALGHSMWRLGQHWYTRRWRTVRPGYVSAEWLHEFGVAADKRRHE